MSPRAHRLIDEALELEQGERSVLVLALLESLEPGDSTVAEAWTAELRQRKEDLRSGAVKAVPWSGAKARLSAL